MTASVVLLVGRAVKGEGEAEAVAQSLGMKRRRRREEARRCGRGGSKRTNARTRDAREAHERNERQQERAEQRGEALLVLNMPVRRPCQSTQTSFKGRFVAAFTRFSSLQESINGNGVHFNKVAQCQLKAGAVSALA